MNVEIFDRAQAIATQLQRVGELTDAVFANVEYMFSKVTVIRAAVRHDHFD